MAEGAVTHAAEQFLELVQSVEHKLGPALTNEILDDMRRGRESAHRISKESGYSSLWADSFFALMLFGRQRLGKELADRLMAAYLAVITEAFELGQTERGKRIPSLPRVKWQQREVPADRTTLPAVTKATLLLELMDRGLSVDMHNIMAREGWRTVGRVPATLEDLLKLPHTGMGRVMELLCCLAEGGYQLLEAETVELDGRTGDARILVSASTTLATLDILGLNGTTFNVLTSKGVKTVGDLPAIFKELTTVHQEHLLEMLRAHGYELPEGEPKRLTAESRIEELLRLGLRQGECTVLRATGHMLIGDLPRNAIELSAIHGIGPARAVHIAHLLAENVPSDIEPDAS